MTSTGSDPPQREGPTAPGTLLLATDLSAASAAATEVAFDLASRLGSSLLIVSVIDLGQLRLPGGRFGSRVDIFLPPSAEPAVRVGDRVRGGTDVIARWRSEP